MAKKQHRMELSTKADRILREMDRIGFLSASSVTNSRDVIDQLMDLSLITMDEQHGQNGYRITEIGKSLISHPE